MKDGKKIVFMGTPDFAVPSLDILVKNGYNIAGVITAPDKPAGRGRKISYSPVKKYALSNNLLVLQPQNLKDENFINRLKSLKPDIQVVIAFRMLPKAVWEIPPLGTFNLHASLLPQYRGAAPINWAVINGEKETGVTTFFIKEEIDTGKIILSEKVEITPNETAGELHDKLMMIGANLVLLTVDSIINNKYSLTNQSELTVEAASLKKAPKIFKEDCRIDWTKSVNEIYNFIRGLSPYPGAFTELVSPNHKTLLLKIYRAEKTETCKEDIIKDKDLSPGKIQTDGKGYLKISCKNGFINITEIQQEGKRMMKIEEFLRGFSINNKKIKILKIPLK